MKIFKTIILIILAIIAVVLIAAFFVKSEYAVEREVTINKPKTEVFEYVKYLKNQNNYSVWAKMDPDMKKEYLGTDGTVGFISSWDSDNEDVGRGEQEIVKIDAGKRIDYELRFYEPYETTDYAYMATEAINKNGTVVTWGFYGKMDYPMNLMFLIYDMDEMIGPDLEEGLQSLKEILE